MRIACGVYRPGFSDNDFSQGARSRAFPALAIVMDPIFRLDTDMSNSEERLINLEARFAWLERHIADQDKAMAEMADEARRLRREIEGLRERLAQSGGAGEGGDPEEPPPPHY
jgi:SlyX protein